jgi:hypothetical protein
MLSKYKVKILMEIARLVFLIEFYNLQIFYFQAKITHSLKFY